MRSRFLERRGGRMLKGRMIWAAKPSTSATTADEPWMGTSESVPPRCLDIVSFAHPVSSSSLDPARHPPSTPY